MNESSKSPELLAYEAETARLKALTEFLGTFAPAIAERAEPGTEDVGEDTSVAVRRAREEAVMEGFRAVAIIAQTWPPIEPEYEPEGEAEITEAIREIEAENT